MFNEWDQVADEPELLFHCHEIIISKTLIGMRTDVYHKIKIEDPKLLIALELSDIAIPGVWFSEFVETCDDPIRMLIAEGDDISFGENGAECKNFAVVGFHNPKDAIRFKLAHT